MSVLAAGNRYLSTIDAAGSKADDAVVGCGQEGDSMEANSVALLMGSPECCERHFGGSSRLCQSARKQMQGSPRRGNVFLSAD